MQHIARKKRSSNRQSAARLAEMRRLYEEEGLSLAMLGKQFGISRQRVHQQLRRAGICTRPNAPKTIDYDVLYNVYVVERLSIQKTAEKLNVDSKVVKRELDRYGIERRKGTPVQIDRGLLEQLYVKQGLSQIEAGKRLGVGPRVVLRELRRHRITVRHNSRLLPVRIEREKLDTLYVNAKRFLYEISRRLGHDPRTISRELKRQVYRLEREAMHSGSTRLP